jgi:putative ATPase
MNIPLAEQLRPTSLEEIAGQEHLLSDQGLIPLLVKEGRPLSILLWGPPGCGKTTLARLYAQAFGSRLISFSPIFHGIQELKKIIQEIEEKPLLHRQPILFIDEIHRFNKAQQDVFLPYLEKGTLILVGATTENPSFALNNALLSRLRVLPLKALEESSLEDILTRYEKKYHPLPFSSEARKMLITHAQGDARHLLNMVENIGHSPSLEPLSTEKLLSLLQKRSALYDKGGDGHYNLISALHKSVRGSDPQAALYWLARMFAGGEDPQFIARRIVRMANEDIGLADPQALTVALDAWKAFDQLGLPEGELALAQAIVYLALAPKSNTIYTAWKAVKHTAENTSHLSPPATILNAPTPLMKEMGYGEGYQYDHDTPFSFSGQNYFPDDLPKQEFYHPKKIGFERELDKRLDYFNKLRLKLK